MNRFKKWFFSVDTNALFGIVALSCMAVIIRGSWMLIELGIADGGWIAGFGSIGMPFIGAAIMAYHDDPPKSVAERDPYEPDRGVR